MARLFISHSSRNNDKAIEVRDWLAANGWDDVFLDLDPERGIVAGQRWKEALQQAASRCEVVLALVSAEWLASSYCKAEINSAQMMGKKTIIALLDGSQVPGDLTDEQFIDLAGDPQAYRRLKKGLELAGLDPLNFPFEPGRRPYPGFAFFEEQDAAVFFGRDAQIVRGLDELRRIVRTGVSRMLVILGASGSGKSSFLRAGLWPRLRRDDRAWLPLAIIRPERAVISGTYGLAAALHQIISEPRFAGGMRQRGLPRSRADIEDFIKTEGGFVTFFDALRDIGQVPGLSGEDTSPPTIVLALDQGEELFNEEGRDEAERFVEILTNTLKTDPHTLAILAMRSDSFPLVQAHPSLAALPKDTFTLDMMLEGSYRAVIEDPARLIQPNPLRIDPQLTEALLEDISGQDALPLLAFTLAHLYENYAADNELTLPGYNKLGRVRGVIDTAVKQAFAAGVAKGELPKEAKAQLALARAAFIPHLAQVNAAGQFVRHVATLEQIPAEARPLIDSFAEQRLLIKDRRKDAEGKDVDVVEVAHETLLRQPPFSEWLEEDREFLIGKQQLQNDLRDWAEAKPADKKGALLTGLKLSRMRAWLAARPQDLTPQEREFGKASIEQADAEDRRKARQRRIVTRASIAAAAVLAVVAVFAGVQWRKAVNAFEARASEVSRFAWSDLGAKQEEAGRLTVLARQNNLEPEVLVDSPISVRDPKAKETGGYRQKVQPDGFDCKTWLESGFRYLYCAVRSVINFEKVQSMSGLQILRADGPYDKEINLSDPYHFGHYNPNFLAWLDKHIIPEGLSDARFNALTQRVYKVYIGPVARALYDSHEILFADPETTRVFARQYSIVQKDYKERLDRRDVNELRFEGRPTAVGAIIAAYQQRLAKRTDPENKMQEDFL